MIVNQILTANRIPQILEEKGINLADLLTINITKRDVSVNIYEAKNIMKFENWTFEPYENQMNDFVGKINVEFEGIKFTSCVRVGELSLLNLG